MSSYEELRGRGPAAFAEQSGRSRYWELLAAERSSMRDPGTGEVRPDLVERVACAACGEDCPYGGFVKEGFTYVRCGVCGTVYLNPQLTDKAMMRFWTSSPVAEAWTHVLRHPAQQEFDEQKFSRALDNLAQAGLRAGSLLDFGCSIGTFLALAQRRGFRVAGIEPGEGARTLAHDLNGLVLVPGIGDLEAGATFDVITAWEVLEHTKDPLAHLRRLRERIAPDGRLVVLVGGNAASLANRIMRGASAAYEFARHWYFTPDSFSRLLQRAAWDVIRIDQTLDELDVVCAYLGYGDPYKPTPISEEVLPPSLVDELRRYVLTHGMGYKFLVTAAPA